MELFVLPILSLIVPGVVMAFVSRAIGSSILALIVSVVLAGIGLLLLNTAIGPQGLGQALIGIFVFFPAALSTFVGGVIGSALYKPAEVHEKVDPDRLR
jgi:ABC-type sugar transport system permease subunit